MTRSILVLFAHPDLAASRVNRAMIRFAHNLHGVAIHDLYALYPDFHIDVRREQRLCERADVIVFHHPFYWYSCPALLKEWQDQVLEHGWAYGPTGDALEGKWLLSAVTTAGPPEAYRPGGRNRYPMRDLLVPFDQTAHLCGMRYLRPLIFQGAHRVDEDQINAHAARYRSLLAALRDGEDCPGFEELEI